MGVIGWVVAGVVALGGLIAVVASWQRKQPFVASLLVIWLLALLGFGVTLFSAPSPTFRAGGFLGWGLMLSTGLWLIGFVGGGVGWSPGITALFPLLAPLLVFIFVPSRPFPALFGVMIGTALVWCCLGRYGFPFAALALTVFAFCVAIGLSFEAVPPHEVLPEAWRFTPVWLTIGGWLALLGITEWHRITEERVAGRWAYSLTFGGQLLGAIAAHYRSGAVNLVQLLLFVLIAITLANLLVSEGSWLAFRSHLLLWVGVFAVVFAYQRENIALAEYSLALVALMVSLYALVMAQQQAVEIGEWNRSSYTAGASLLTLFASFRLFIETYPLRTPRADLYTHYSLMGFLLAIPVLAMLAHWWRGGEEAMEEVGIFRLLLVGFWAAAAPVALAALFGVRAAAGWLGGGFAALLSLLTFLQPPATAPLLALLPPLFFGVAAALPLTALVEPFADLPRLSRVWILLAILGGVLLSLIAETLVGRRRREERREMSSTGNQPVV